MNTAATVPAGTALSTTAVRPRGRVAIVVIALPALAVSMAACVALFAGDMQHGLSDVMPRQQPILITVLAIAAGLVATALVARRNGRLR